MPPTWGSATARRSCQVSFLKGVSPEATRNTPHFLCFFIITTGIFYSQSQTGSFVLCHIMFRVLPNWFCLPRCEVMCSFMWLGHCDQAWPSASQDCCHQHNLQCYISAIIDVPPCPLGEFFSHSLIWLSVSFSPSPIPLLSLLFKFFQCAL